MMGRQVRQIAVLALAWVLVMLVGGLDSLPTAYDAVSTNGNVAEAHAYVYDSASTSTTPPANSRIDARRGERASRPSLQSSIALISGRSAAKAGPGPRPTFVASENGVVVPTSRARLEGGFQSAGFPSRPTSGAAGREYALPDGSLVRVMEPSGQAPLRASFTNSSGGPINPFTGLPVQPPPGLSSAQRLAYVRARTHVELFP